jgi:hypothetical protein
VATTAALPLSEAVSQCINFYRRFGVAHWQDAPVALEWQKYTAHLMTLETHDQRVAWTQAFFAQSPRERLPPSRRQFGCFSCDPPDADGVVRILFANSDHDGIGPLSRTKVERRRQELQAMFTYMKHTYADANTVRGGSWLYHLDTYRRLFPPVYGDSSEVLAGTLRFQGMSSWGQFLDRREDVKPALREQFLESLKKLDMHRLWEVFPLPACSAQLLFRRSMTFIISMNQSHHGNMYSLYTMIVKTRIELELAAYPRTETTPNLALGRTGHTTSFFQHACVSAVWPAAHLSH